MIRARYFADALIARTKRAVPTGGSRISKSDFGGDILFLLQERDGDGFRVGECRFPTFRMFPLREIEEVKDLRDFLVLSA